MEVSELLRKHNVNEKVADYLLSFEPPITSLASVACLGESPELLEQLFKDAPLTHLPLVLSARAFFVKLKRNTLPRSLSFVPLAVLGVPSLLTPINLDVKSVFSIATPNLKLTLIFDVDF